MRILKHTHWQSGPADYEYTQDGNDFVYHDFMSSKYTGMIGII